MKAITTHDSVTFKDHISIDAAADHGHFLDPAQALEPVLILHDSTAMCKTQAQAWSGAPGLSVQPLKSQLSDLLAQSDEISVSAVVVCADAPSAGLIKELGELSAERGIASLLWVAKHSDDLVGGIAQAGISSYFVGPMSLAQLDAVLAFARQQAKVTQQLNQALQQAHSKLQARKLIERAKGLLMQQNSWSEAHAYEQMRSSAMNKGLPMDKLASRIINVFEQYGTGDHSAQKSLSA